MWASARERGRVSVRGWLQACANLLLIALPVSGAAGQETFAPPPDRLTLEAMPATGSIVMDGLLDEPAWGVAPVARGFVQIEPNQGTPAPLDTEVRVLFDDRFLYVGAFLADPDGIQSARVRGLARDFAWFENDAFGVTLDPFGDGRIAMTFQVNAAGVQRDQLIFDGTVFQPEWDGVWHARTAEVAGGWTVEMAIPWSTLRYREGVDRWRVNFVRTRRGEGETTGWSPWPRAFGPYRLEYGGELMGIQPPAAGRNLQLQPYTLGRRTTSAFPPGTPGSDVEVGLDAKWVVDPRTVLDLTVNTDFAQVEDDRQVINLSRSAVLFPERRPFFLENAGLFQVGESRMIRPFFSRRMGLDAGGRPVPIQAGARLTARREGGSLGALVLRQGGQGDAPHTTFGVFRANRNLGQASRAGGYLGFRHDEGDGWNATGAMDGLWRPSASTQVLGFLSGNLAEGASSGGAGYLWIASTTNRGYFGWLQAFVGPDYNPGTGFVTRRNLHLASPAVRLDLRPGWLPEGVRSIEAAATTFFYYRATDLQFEQGSVSVGPAINLPDGTKLSLTVEPTWQRLDRTFRPLPGIAVAEGSYHYTRWSGVLQWAPSARVTGSLGGFTGGFYDGTLHRGSAALRAVLSPHLIVGGDYSVDALRGVGEGSNPDLDAHLLGSEVRLALNPRVQFSVLFQRNSALETTAWNARFAWEFRPLSYLYLVYNDRRVPDLTTDPRDPFMNDRQFVAKVNWLLGG